MSKHLAKTAVVEFAPVRRAASLAVCPCCGHPTPSDQVAALLPGKQRQIYEIVRDAGTLGICTERIMDRLYADDRNGGPTGNVISSLISAKINPKLKPFDLVIRGRYGPSGFYQLMRIKP